MNGYLEGDASIEARNKAADSGKTKGALVVGEFWKRHVRRARV